MKSIAFSMSTLLEDNRELLDNCLARLDDFFKDNTNLKAIAEELPLDETSIVRFVLATKQKVIDQTKVEDCLFKSIIDMLQEREKYSDIFKIAKKEMERNDKYFPLHLPGQCGGFLGDHLLLVAHLGKTDFNELATSFGNNKEAAVEYGLKCGEFIRVACDRRTRSSGKLSQMIYVIDLDGFSMFNLNGMMMQAIGMNSALNDVLNPVFISKAIVLRPPFAFSFILSAIKPFMPKSVDLNFCKMSSGDISTCPFVNKFIDGPLNVPKEFGGKFSDVLNHEFVRA